MTAINKPSIFQHIATKKALMTLRQIMTINNSDSGDMPCLRWTGDCQFNIVSRTRMRDKPGRWSADTDSSSRLQSELIDYG